MLKYWTLHSTGTPADWKALVDALYLIGYGNLSNTIERKYLSNTEGKHFSSTTIAKVTVTCTCKISVHVIILSGPVTQLPCLN